MNNKFKILLFCKDSSWGNLAINYLKLMNQECTVFQGVHGDSFPQISSSENDLVISFSSPWIIPPQILEQAKFAAINFHPGPPQYPGIGCTNFALYEGAEKFGVTCHYMAPKVDTGEIIKTKYFPIFPQDTVETLTERTYHYMFGLYQDVIDGLLYSKKLPVSNEVWERKPFTRKELNELCVITADMKDTEIRKRIKATTFPGKPGPHIILGGEKFILGDVQC
jgi:methionyl-tRNA formyltransferase